MDKTAWLIIYAGLVSIRNHPKNAELNTAANEPQHLANMADIYYREYERRFPCLGSSQPSQEA